MESKTLEGRSSGVGNLPTNPLLSFEGIGPRVLLREQKRPDRRSLKSSKQLPIGQDPNAGPIAQLV